MTKAQQRIILLVCDLSTGKLTSTSGMYYVSTQDRLCVETGPNKKAHKRTSMGQYVHNAKLNTAYMYDLDLQDQEYYRNRMHFMQCVARTLGQNLEDTTACLNRLG